MGSFAVCDAISILYLLCVFVHVVDIREVTEVREGTESKDFERQQVELRKIDQFCFVIYYTSEFKLKTLSVAGIVYVCCGCGCGQYENEGGTIWQYPWLFPYIRFHNNNTILKSSLI